MKLENKVIKNASWIILCRIVQAVLNLIISMITARYLGPSNYGVINYAASITAFVLPVAYLGLNHILVQEAVQHPEQEGLIFGTSLLLSFGASVVCLFGVTGFAFIANAGDSETILVCALYSTMLIFQAIELIQYWFQAHYLSKYVSIISLCAYVVISGYKIFLLATRKGVCWFAISNAIDHMLIAVALVITYRKLGGQKFGFSREIAGRMLSKSRYYIVSSMMVTIFAQTDKIMLTLMADEAATGYYSAAVSCAGMASFVFGAIIDSARPAIIEDHKVSKQKFENSICTLYCVVIYFALTLSVVISLFAKPLIGFLYGPQYAPAVSALKIVVWYTTFSYLGAARDVWILAENKGNLLWKINMTGAVLNVLLNLMLIPSGGIAGAAVASLTTQVFTNLIAGWIFADLRSNNYLIIKGADARFLLQATRKVMNRTEKNKKP